MIMRTQGLSRNVLWALLAFWTTCLAAANTPLPRLYDFPDPRLGPRENVGFAALAVCAGLHGFVCRSRVEWLWQTASRSRLTVAVMFFCLSGTAGWVGATAYAGQVAGADIALSAPVWPLLFSISVVCGFVAEWAAVIAPLAFVLLSSISPLLPWSVNILYNAEASAVLQVAEGCMCALAVATLALGGCAGRDSKKSFIALPGE